MRIFGVCFVLFCQTLSIVIAHRGFHRHVRPAVSEKSGEVIVATELGNIRGKYMRSSSGRSFAAFRGIRYAQPPVADLRFRDPVPVEKWNEDFDATADGPRCPQPLLNSTDLSEDCLRLNVYTHEVTQVPLRRLSNVLRPVVVFLYPGGFYTGSGQSKEYGPDYLMNRDIVLVTLNYRLGTLGYLSTGTADAPGNAGFKDQVEAIRWVKRHIDRFGGNPNSITLMGCSAGAVSITIHMFSPMTRDLFHRAFISSGTVIPPRGYPPHQLDLARKQARLVNCTEETIPEMVDCLRSTDFREFVRTLPMMFEIGDGLPVLLWKVVVEEDFGQERFMVEDPHRVYQAGRFMKIPVIAGVTTEEFASVGVNFLRLDDARVFLDQNWNSVAPIVFQYERNTSRSDEISTEFRKQYLGEGPLSFNNSVPGLPNLFGDAIIGVGVNRFVNFASKQTVTYYYRFSYQGRYSYFYYPDETTPYGVMHQDDMFYYFYLSQRASLFTEQDPEYRIMERMTRIVEKFAYDGNPNNRHRKCLENVQWTPYNNSTKPYLDIGDEVVMKQDLYGGRYAVWWSLFPANWMPPKEDVR